MTMEFRPGQLEAGPVKLRRLSQAEEAIMPVRIRSTRGVDDKIAAELVEQARAVVGQYPEDAAVLTGYVRAALGRLVIQQIFSWSPSLRSATLLIPED